MANATKTDDWGHHASDYERRIGDVVKPPIEAMIQAADKLWPFSEATAICDNGTGTGICMNAIIDKFGSQLPADVRLIASDISPGMIESVREKQRSNAGNRLWDRLETVVLDSQNLSALQDNSLSHMTASFSFMFAEEPRRALREAHRVLTRENGGGVLALSSWADLEWCRLFEVTKQIKPDAPQGVPFAELWKSGQGIRGELEATGFKNVHVQEVKTYVPFDKREDVANTLVRSGNPGVNRMLVRLTPEEVDKVAQLMIQRLEHDYPDLPARLTGTAIVVTAQK